MARKSTISYCTGLAFSKSSSSKVLRRVTVGKEPEGVTIHPGGKVVYITNEGDNSVSVLDVENIRLHYALTLRHWLQRYEAAVERVRAMFDEKFVRMWRMYLASCIATFTTGRTDVIQAELINA